jgi:hypothetical protein
VLGSVAWIIAGALIVIAALMVATAVAAFIGFRLVRRKWRLVKVTVAVRTATAIWNGTETLRGTWNPYRARRAMWRSVTGAERAVADAERAGASMGDLPALCRRLRTGATSVDGLLDLGTGLPGGTAAVRREVDDVMAAARGIHHAAVRAGRDVAAPGIQALLADAERELECVAEGVAVSRSALGPPLAPPTV